MSESTHVCADHGELAGSGMKVVLGRETCAFPFVSF